jgi:hypothetical protein
MSSPSSPTLVATKRFTSPEENFSMIEPILFLDMFFNPEWHPTRNSHFQKSRHFRFWRICATTLATIILFTKTIHFMFSSSLLVEETKEKNNQDDDNRIKAGKLF